MTHLVAEPQLLAAAAADVEQIGSAISAASAAAAGPTSGLIAPAADEVSAAISTLFGQYGQEYHAAVAQAAVFHSRFTQALAAAGGAYAAAEASAANTLSKLEAAAPSALGGSSTPAPTSSSAPAAIDPTVAIVMGGSGNPIPNTKFVNGVLNWATKGGFVWSAVQALPTPEGLSPLTGVKSLPLNTSVSQGIPLLDAAIKQQLGLGNSVLVQGYSQSAIIASFEMRNLMNGANPPTGSQLYFNLLGDPMNPNGGLLERFVGLDLPTLGINFYGATPANTPWTTNIYTLEYDGFADFPRYPIDILSDLNAVAGIVYVHPNYPNINPLTLPAGDIVKLPVSPDYTGPLANTSYYMVLTPNLPLLEPLRALPVLGNPLADLLQPDLRYLVNWGYGDPAYGYSTAPANVPTPFGLFPPMSATTALAGDLVMGVPQGITAAARDVLAEGMSGFSLAGHSLSNLSLSGITNSLSPLSSPSTLFSPPSINGFIASLQAAHNNVFNAISKAGADAYAVLLPTADIANAAVTAVPAYDASLLVDGISEAGGNPLGLINAVGSPIAATTGVLTLLGGLEVLVLAGGAADVAKTFTGLVP
ncbi:PE-PPE domain-containing protein [Mycobacterium sp.]|uniref:PE family protein n=1 Tax=Mycobacterium sp. TaxID=1785 RepID=UPI0025CBF9C7|nr:PE-PPE domain-containing protein [Mycobacterium sp.]MBW0011682.1 PE-PPE domain-containing protein [Mycobacterium sp.]